MGDCSRESRKRARNNVLTSRRLRIALYSHDTMGLGHIRRNLLIAQSLCGSPLHPEILLITGAWQASAFSLPYRVSCLTLPSFHKGRNGEYRPQYRGVNLNTLIDFRSTMIRQALEGFDPDVLIVDKVPRGALHELDSTLQFLRNGRKTRCILGLRDVLDDPQTVQCEWQANSYEDAIREYYDSIWIYGDPKVYDTVREYRFPSDIAAMVSYTGYHDQRFRLRNVPPRPETSSYVLCLVGGGQDGARLVEKFGHCELPEGMGSIIVCGPFMPGATQRRLERCASNNPGFKVFDFLAEPVSLLTQAARVIAMGGYNTICEVLSFEKTALIVPRVIPRREQAIRAERLREMGLIDVLQSEEVTPDALTRWLHEEKQPPQVHGRIDMDGLKRIPEYLSLLLSRQKLELQPIL